MVQIAPHQLHVFFYLSILKNANYPFFLPNFEKNYHEKTCIRCTMCICCEIRKIGQQQIPTKIISEHIWNFIVVYSVVSEMWSMIIWTSAANTCTRLASIKSYIERLIWIEFGLEVTSQGELLHWGTGRYLMNWIQVVCFKLKEIWPLFAPAKAKKSSLFLLPFRQTFEWKQISVQIWPWSYLPMRTTSLRNW